MALILGEDSFTSKAAARRHAKELLRTLPVGTVLTGRAFLFVSALLLRHPKSAQKIGAGIAAISIHAGLHGSPGFLLRRTDGTTTDFSYMKCLGVKTDRHDVLYALRVSIDDQIQQVRAEALDGRTEFLCPIDKVMTPVSQAHVHHVHPETFHFLVEAFLRQENLELLAVPLAGGGDGEMGKRLADPAFAQRWRDFHRANAKLLVVSKAANLWLG